MNSLELKSLDDPNSKYLLRLHAMARRSRANGPGCRAVLWTQGCRFHCKGCFNPQTHALTAGTLYPIKDLVDFVTEQKDSVEGITLTGGEPLMQSEPLAAFLELLRKKSPQLSVILLSGYEWDEIGFIPSAKRILNNTDVVIAGRFDQTRKLSRGLRGSSNKTVHLLSDRYLINEIESTPPAELIISPEGAITISGIDPPLYKILQKEAL